MLEKIKKLFGISTPDYKQLLSNGGIIVDVRSPGEYKGGHIKSAVNIPVDKLVSNLNRLGDKNKPVITCCASGVRSSSAKRILESKGYTNVHNGGSWQSLNKKLQ